MNALLTPWRGPLRRRTSLVVLTRLPGRVDHGLRTLSRSWPVRPLAEAPAGSGLAAVQGDQGLPLLGHTLDHIRFGSDLGRERYARLGPVSWMGAFGTQVVVVAGPDATQSVLDDSAVLATGAAGLGADLGHYLARDSVLVLIVVLAAVLLILILTLRALAAPLYLLASVVVSCAAALGLTTLVFQHLLGQDIHFTVPVITFVLLVAVGADYNILLMSRMRESGLALTRSEVARAVTATGPVITAAGVIFASTFVALLFSPVEALTQTGFAVASGLLLDTFIVRTLVVPACAALFEERSWWPHRNPTPETARPQPATLADPPTRSSTLEGTPR